MHQLRTPSDPHDVKAPPIIAEDLTARYDGNEALRSVSFRIEAGQQVAIVGPNGAGKTTLFKIIAGILQPAAGRVRVHGHKPGRHICVAYVPQRSEVDWNFPVTVHDVVMMGRTRAIGLFRWAGKPDHDMVKRALEQVRMAELGTRQIGELSGGQQQRVFLAQARAQEAEIMLLDEPLSGLDVPSQEMILEILAELRSEGVTVIVATHDLNLAADRFDQVMLLNRNMIAFGPPGEVFTHQNLLEAYGGHLHVVSGTDGLTVLADIHHFGQE